MAKITTGMLSDTINGIKINSSIRCHSSNYTNKDSRDVDFIVLHYTGNSRDLAVNNVKYFAGANRSASAHFFVDDNEIYQGIELRDYAWHCAGGAWQHPSCRNTNSWGIEMCCSGNYIVSEKTKENAAYLTAHLCKLIGVTASTVDTYVLRHYDTVGKLCPKQMAGKDNAEWKAFKQMVKNILKGETSSSPSTSTPSTTTDKVYRIRKSWEDSKSQLGAYSSLDNAKNDWKSGYFIYDWNGKVVYPETKTETTTKQVCDEVDCNADLPMLKKGCTGIGVKVLQTILGIEADGSFGNVTAKAVADFQTNRGLTADSIVGAETWKALAYRLKTNTYK